MLGFFTSLKGEVVEGRLTVQWLDSRSLRSAPIVCGYRRDDMVEDRSRAGHLRVEG